MKGSIILKIFLVLLCGALLVSLAGLMLWDRQQQQEDNARLRQLIEADQAEPDPEDVKGFAAFMERFSKGLPIERAAVACLTAEDGSSGS